MIAPIIHASTRMHYTDDRLIYYACFGTRVDPQERTEADGSGQWTVRLMLLHMILFYALYSINM